MPRMPEVDDLRPVEGISPGVPKQPRDFISPAIQNLGQSATGAGDRLYAQAEADRADETALQLAKANSAWTVGRLEADAGFDLTKNPEYEKWNKIYDDTVPKLAEASAAIIKDPKVRARFLEGTKADVAKGRLAVNDRATALDREKKMAEFAVGLEERAKAAGTPGLPMDEYNRIIERVGGDLGNLQAAGVITEGQRIEMQDKFVRRVANVQMGWAVDQDPAKVLKWLRGELPVSDGVRLQGSNPALVDRTKKMVAILKAKGIDVEIVSGVRTKDEQDAIYRQGRSAPGAKVTNAKGGHSAHNHGSAFDVVPTALKDKKNWDPGNPLWDEVGKAAQEAGLSWGGNWRMKDLAHVYLKGGADLPSVPDDLWARLVQAESGGNQAAVSPKGARGRAQIMPGTAPEAAKLAGLKWDPALFNGTDEAAAQYNEALGKAYLNQQMKTFKDPAKALAAYNAGPGATKIAIAKHGSDWLNYMPEETQNYVAKIMGGGGDAPAEPVPDFVQILSPEDRLAFTQQAEVGAKKLYEIEQNNRVQQAADTVYDQYADDAAKAYEALRSIPDAETRQEAEKLYDARVAREKTINEAETKATKAELYDTVTAPTANTQESLDRIALANIPPGDKEWLRKIAIEGPPRYDDQSTVDMLERLQALDEQAFIGLDLGRPEYAGKLSSKTLLDFRKAQQTAEKALSGDDSKESKAYIQKKQAVRDADSIVDNGLRQIGIVLTGKDVKPVDFKIAQEIRTMAGQRIEKLYDKLGRQPLESEIDDELKHMWKTIGQKPGGLFGIGKDDGQQIDDVLRELDTMGIDITRLRQSMVRTGKAFTVENLLKFKTDYEAKQKQ